MKSILFTSFCALIVGIWVVGLSKFLHPNFTFPVVEYMPICIAIGLAVNLLMIFSLIATILRGTQAFEKKLDLSQRFEGTRKNMMLSLYESLAVFIASLVAVTLHTIGGTIGSCGDVLTVMCLYYMGTILIDTHKAYVHLIHRDYSGT